MFAANLSPVQTPSTPLSSRGRATRVRLLAAARQVFEERGFPDTRINHITAAAGVSYGSFYTHFTSKESIFEEVASALFEEMFASDDAPHGTTPLERIAHANRTYAERYRANARLMGIVEQVATIDAHFRGLRQQHRRTTTDRTSASIRRWQEQGTVPRELDARTAALALGAMLDRTLYLQYVLNEGEATDEDLIGTLNLLTAQALGLRD